MYIYVSKATERTCLPNRDRPETGAGGTPSLALLGHSEARHCQGPPIEGPPYYMLLGFLGAPC